VWLEKLEAVVLVLNFFVVHVFFINDKVVIVRVQLLNIHGNGGTVGRQIVLSSIRSFFRASFTRAEWQMAGRCIATK